MMTNLTEKLHKIQCPINWDLETVPWTRDDSRKLLLNKLDGEFEDTDGASLWQKISQRLVLSYLEYTENGGDLRQMKNYLDTIGSILTENALDDFIKKHSPAVQYVLDGMLAHYHCKEKEDLLAETYLSKPSFEDLPSKTQAGILALKACCNMEFGPGDASIEALKTINKALELDSEEQGWDFLKAKCLGRSRRYRKFGTPPSEEELRCLRRAIESRSFPSYLVFYGQALLEYAKFSPDCQGREPLNFAIRQTYISECVGKMRMAANLGEHNPVILCRVAKGLMRQYGSDDIDELVHLCVHKSLKLLPSSGFVNEVAGDYFRYRDRDTEKAVRYYSIAAHDHNISTAYIKLFDLMLLTKSDSELDNEVCRFWGKRSELPLERLRALPAMTAYNFFVKNDIVRAVQYRQEWILSTSLNGEAECTHGSSTFVRTDDLTKDILGEVQLRLRDTQNNMSTEDEQTLRSFRETVIEARPDINVDEVTTSREQRIKTYLLNVWPYQKKNILERKFKVTLPPQNTRSGGNHRRHNNNRH